ncbi:hypothetical protein RN347_06040 [Halomonas sp. PAMB 3264]|uniref:hypothetical protein n=1 Tax=Halomonas sp. PAMB 3264 TaxID=3075222 RepID=UPI0028989AFB|nr:hypothetical protein [Halomonas sp. PAMB 3264]WNL43462.1 hypothetical protein RN347_06040 [Halomonas sp. PAMB 3264]
MAGALGVGLLSLALSGCFYANTSQAPIATTYPYSEQQRMQAAHHWEILARHEASQILQRERVRFRDLHIKNPHPDGYIPYSGGEFDRGFRTFLTSELVTRGANVTTAAGANSVDVIVDVEIVEHRDRGFIRPPTGAFTALTAGIAVATIPINHWAEPALGLIPAGIAADVFSGSWTYTGNEEIIITTQVVDGDRILYSSSNIYYINGGDRRQYAPQRVHYPDPAIPLTDTW